LLDFFFSVLLCRCLLLKEIHLHFTGISVLLITRFISILRIKYFFIPEIWFSPLFGTVPKSLAGQSVFSGTHLFSRSLYFVLLTRIFKLPLRFVRITICRSFLYFYSLINMPLSASIYASVLYIFFNYAYYIFIYIFYIYVVQLDLNLPYCCCRWAFEKKCELLFGSCLAHFSVLLHFELILVFFRDFLL